MVNVKVDLKHREKLKRLHTATHILNFSAKKILGNHVWQNGSNLKSDMGTLDITHYENLSEEQISKIERECNRVVFDNKEVSIEEIDRSIAEKRYGFTLYQGGAIPMKTLRIVKIDENDIEACGGIHMEKTGGIGLIKIVDTQKIQDGVVRIKFVVNEYALDFVSKKQRLLAEIEEVFSVDDSSVVRTCEKFFNEWKEQKKEIERFKELIKKSYIKEIQSSKGNELVLEGDFDMGFLMELYSQGAASKDSFKLVSPKFIIATKDFKVENFKKEIDKKGFSIYIL